MGTSTGPGKHGYSSDSFTGTLFSGDLLPGNHLLKVVPLPERFQISKVYEKSVGLVACPDRLRWC